MSEEKISRREFARRIGKSEGYIRRMIADGVITSEAMVELPNGSTVLIWEKAKRDWDVNYVTTRELKPSQIRKSEKAIREEVAPAEDEEVVPPTPYGERKQGTLPDGRKTKTELDRLRLEIRVQKEVIDLRRIKGELVEEKEVYRALFALGQEMKKDFLVVPDKVTDLMLAAPSRHEAYQILYNELFALLEQYSNLSNDNFKIIP